MQPPRRIAHRICEHVENDHAGVLSAEAPEGELSSKNRDQVGHVGRDLELHVHDLMALIHTIIRMIPRHATTAPMITFMVRSALGGYVGNVELLLLRMVPRRRMYTNKREPVVA